MNQGNPYPVDAPTPRLDRPYRVTAYKTHWYWGQILALWVVGDYRWYWQANVVSWWHHNILGHGCNTWRNDMRDF